jgi:hypothetical protein
MAWRIDKEIVSGWIDNRVPGKVTGEIILQGKDKPIRLELEGNCHRDLAGSKCEFKNPTPLLNERLLLDFQQTGKVGDMTASRRNRIPDIPALEYYEQKKKGLKPPDHLSNVLYLEWFSESNGRVVIELPDAEIDVTLPVWKMTSEDELKQKKENMNNMTSFLDKLVEAKQPKRAPKIEEKMDEFEWELLFQDSDSKSTKYRELLEKYMDHPNCDDIINKQMGWNIESFNTPAEFIEEEKFNDEAFSKNPERKEHPLVERIGNLWLSLHQHVKQTPYHHSQEPVGLLISDLVFHIQFANAKAGSVLGDRDYFENGMITATLKRAITGIHKALNIADNEDVAKALPDIIEPTKAELFVIREEMIKIMNKLRKG